MRAACSFCHVRGLVVYFGRVRTSGVLSNMSCTGLWHQLFIWVLHALLMLKNKPCLKTFSGRFFFFAEEGGPDVIR